MANPATVFTSDAAYPEPRIVFSVAFSAAKQVMVYAEFGDVSQFVTF